MRNYSDLNTMHRSPRKMLPRDYYDVLMRRFLPVLCLTYISSVIGIAGQNAAFLHYLLKDKSAYVMALFVVAWVSLPGFVWMLIKGIPEYARHADQWYKIIAILMMSILCVSYILLPEANGWGLRTYLAASIPMLVIMYAFFVRGGLPALAAHPLNALGLTFLIYGAAIQFLY